MKRGANVVVLGGLLLAAIPWLQAAPAVLDSRLAAPKRNYLLGCGGCHGVDGVSNSRLVPALRGQVGYFLNNQAGREYLVRLPNVAFYTIPDRDLSEMMNFVVFVLGGASVPSGTKPYTAAEVARLRRQPLTEVSLVNYREHLIGTLSAQHDAPESLREYGSDHR